LTISWQGRKNIGIGYSLSLGWAVTRLWGRGGEGAENSSVKIRHKGLKSSVGTEEKGGVEDRRKRKERGVRLYTSGIKAAFLMGRIDFLK